MLPAEDDVVAAYAWVASRFALGKACSRPAIRAALREAEHLAEDVYEGPAALLYAFARSPRAFAGARTMTVLLVLAQVASSGQRLLPGLGPRELGGLVEDVRRGERTYAEVRAVLSDGLFPFGG